MWTVLSLGPGYETTHIRVSLPLPLFHHGHHVLTCSFGSIDYHITFPDLVKMSSRPGWENFPVNLPWIYSLFNSHFYPGPSPVPWPYGLFSHFMTVRGITFLASSPRPYGQLHQNTAIRAINDYVPLFWRFCIFTVSLFYPDFSHDPSAVFPITYTVHTECLCPCGTPELAT